MSIFGIHDKYIRDNALRIAGGDPTPEDRQIARTRLHHNDKGQLVRVDKISGTTVTTTEFSYDESGRLVEVWKPSTLTRKVMVYDAEDGRLIDTITYRVPDPDR